MKEKGITLIALVVTIIVLLIMAGVSIRMIIGQDALIQKTKDTKSEYESSASYEQRSIESLEKTMDEQSKK